MFFKEYFKKKYEKRKYAHFRAYLYKRIIDRVAAMEEKLNNQKLSYELITGTYFNLQLLENQIERNKEDIDNFDVEQRLGIIKAIRDMYNKYISCLYSANETFVSLIEKVTADKESLEGLSIDTMKSLRDFMKNHVQTLDDINKTIDHILDMIREGTIKG